MNPADRELSSLAFGWRIERRDGAGLALTSHDRTLERDGVVYQPAPGMAPAAIKRNGGLEASSGEVEGAISSRALTDEDLRLGRWDGAAMKLVAFDWEGGGDELSLMSGEIGGVEKSEHGFSAELQGVAAKLTAPACPVTTPECRAAFGDRSCRVDLSGHRRLARVVAQDGNIVTIAGATSTGLICGSVLVASGSMKGWRSPILAVNGDDLSLRDRPLAAIAPGSRLWLVDGCDKRFETCVTVHANAINFRGEPFVPGNDLLTRYPGA